MLTSARISEFEPLLPPSPSTSRSRVYRLSRTFTPATPTSTSRLPSPPRQSPVVLSCLSPSSAFYQVLTAPYRPAASSLVCQRGFVRPRHLELRHSSIGEGLSPDETDNYDVEHAGDDATASIHTTRRIYSPHGRWAWADGLSIDDSEDLMPLESGSICSTSIKRGTLRDRRITYISKCWDTSQQHKWLGFYSELALYKADRYLKPLQGDVLPWIIGVHVLPGAISIAMEPPHHAFWIEASPDMPNILKERCIMAFEKIHERGILHGDVELRHMLIGGDGKVTIIDFQASRALVPNLDVMLLQATPSDLKLEMRRVKYKLDYDGARRKETEKIMRSEDRERRHEIREIKLLHDGQGGGQAHEGIPEDDIIDPPVHPRDWNESWANAAANAPPTRFVMPGQTSEALEEELRNFLAIIERMETTKSPAKSTPDSGRPQATPTYGTSSTSFVDPFPDEEPVVPAIESRVRYGLRKRKLDELSASGISHRDDHLNKRPRSDDGPSTLLAPITENEDKSIRPGLPMDPISVDYTPDQSQDKDRFNLPPLTDKSVAPDVTSTPPSSDSRFPPIKVRDFAYEPYDGPRGYYAPYHNLESAVSRNRHQWVQDQNQQKRVGLGLSRPRLAAEGTIGSLNSTSKRSIFDRSFTRIALGSGSIRIEAVAGGAHGSARKRKPGDQESEMLEEDFLRIERRAAKARRMTTMTDHSARHRQATGPSLDSLDVQSARGRMVSKPLHDRQILGSRALEFISEDRAVATVQGFSSRHLTAGERMAFATLGRLPPSSRIQSSSASISGSSVVNASGGLRTYSIGPPVLSTTQSGTHRRTKSHHPGSFDVRPSKLQRAQLAVRSLSPTSEEEVEALLCPQPSGSHLPVLNPPSSWVDFLLQWVP